MLHVPGIQLLEVRLDQRRVAEFGGRGGKSEVQGLGLGVEDFGAGFGM